MGNINNLTNCYYIVINTGTKCYKVGYFQYFFFILYPLTLVWKKKKIINKNRKQKREIMLGAQEKKKHFFLATLAIKFEIKEKTEALPTLAFMCSPKNLFNQFGWFPKNNK